MRIVTLSSEELTDSTWNFVPVAIWSIVEVHLAIVSGMSYAPLILYMRIQFTPI